MPRLNRFRLERKITPDKVRKHSTIIKQNSPPQFQKLFLDAEVTLPTKLQTFLSQLRFPDSESVRNNSSKVRVVLKVTECRDTPSCITVKKDQNCVGVIDPTPSRRSQNSNTNVNLFTFDSILTDSDSPDFLFNNALVDPILDLIKGKDSCIFSFGHAALGKTESMIGRDHSIHKIGIIPCALVWVFKLIKILEVSTNVRYSVHISAKEVSSKNIVRDLLTNCKEQSSGSADSRPAGTCIRDKSSAATPGGNQKKLLASTIREAAAILDSALATRSNDNDSMTHLQMIIHLCQHRADANEHSMESNTNIAKVESRLYLLDLGSGRHGNEDQKILSLQGMSKVILALYTSQRHIVYKDNVLTQLLKDTLNPNISTTMVLHISSKEQNYSETLQVVQLAAKLHRMHLKKYRSVGFSVSDETSSCSSSSSGFQSRRLRPHMGIGAARRSSGNSSASSEFDLTSASELSCCETVIFRGEINHSSGGDKSPDRFSGKRKLRSVSSESDNCFSDKDSSKSLTCSSGTIASPSVIRRRRTSPRTNARAWPSTNESFNGTLENGSELWVDGPNAVYKVEKIENKLKTNEMQNLLFLEPVIKPVMISKETQCDDVWDSASSMTDGSSHSNTLDRKDHRPLSDISECTEETESNIATESELGRINMTDQIESTNVLDDLLESTFGVSPVQSENNPKPLGHAFLNSQNIADVHLQFFEKMTKPLEMSNVENNNELKRNQDENKSQKEPVEQHKQKSKDMTDNKRHYHSASDSKRSSKSDNKGKRSKSRCKKCSKKSENHCSKSMSSSNSTDFSRVTSWIENVEYEIQSFNTQELMNIQCKRPEGINQMHHHSQPDISYQWDFFNANRSHFYPLHCQYQVPSNNQIIHNDSVQPQYSLYDGYKMTLKNPHSNPPSCSSRGSTQVTPITPTVPLTQHIQHANKPRESLSTRQLHRNSPKPRRSHSNVSNISLPAHCLSVSHQPLPPLPKSSVFIDTHIPPIENHIKPHSYNRTSSTGSAPGTVPNPANVKCKTLPRDIYLDSISHIKQNQSDNHHSKTPHVQSAITELKFKDKSKMEAKKILSIIFSPFINLRKKMNRSKANSDINFGFGESENKSLENRSNISAHQISDWSPIVRKLETNLVLSSPYNLVTQPKTSILPTESSGHGSDSSSFHNRDLLKTKPNDLSRRHKCRSGSVTYNSRNIHRQRPTSSGYGSIIIKGDSEVSSHNDSSSEYSLTGLTSSKVGLPQTRMKHSRSLSNYKSLLDSNFSNVSKPERPEVSNISCSMERNVNFHENVKIAEDLLIQEKLRMSLKEERRIVIQLIETNRLRGIPIDVSVMNLMCFKCVDNFDVNSQAKRNECELLIEKIVQEIELLKHKLVQAQHHLFLITSFDCSPKSQ